MNGLGPYPEADFKEVSLTQVGDVVFPIPEGNQVKEAFRVHGSQITFPTTATGAAILQLPSETKFHPMLVCIATEPPLIFNHLSPPGATW